MGSRGCQENNNVEASAACHLEKGKEQSHASADGSKENVSMAW